MIFCPSTGLVYLVHWLYTKTKSNFGGVGGCKLILITLTGLEVLVLEDLGFLTAICMYPQIGSKQKMSGDKGEAALKISMPFTLG